ncbi:MAG: lecithin retinol acyltransferase family protein [Nostoc sp. S4]|nr:lecithin retinol acyltransferase family protein [Nostoc sp. S4]
MSVFEPCNSSLADEIVRKAEFFVGESGYNLVLSNCEHFASYCVNGIWKSKQIINKANQTSKSFLNAEARALSKPNIIELARKAAMGQQDPRAAVTVFVVVGIGAAAVLSPAIEKVTEIVFERRNTKK